MDISEEIAEKAEHIIRLLKKGKFFDDYPFVLPIKFKISLQEQMWRKYKRCGEINLDTEELTEIIYKLNRDGLSDTIFEMCEKGYLKMAVNPAGELVYSINSDNKGMDILTKSQKYLLETFYIKKDDKR
jgi:hypothetical protein